MFGKKSSTAGASPSPISIRMKSSAPAIDSLAVITAIAAAGLGGGQLFAPLAAAPLSGLEDSLASRILAVQWLFLAGLLLLGGATRLRVVTIFAAEFLMIGSLAALAVTVYAEPGSVAPFTHGAIAVLAFACSGFARLTDKADLKKELRLLREHAGTPTPPPAPLGQEPTEGNNNG